VLEFYGEIDNSSLNHLLGPILTSASLPLSLINPGQSIRGVCVWPAPYCAEVGDIRKVCS
jgi:hypothetical protein